MRFDVRHHGGSADRADGIAEQTFSALGLSKRALDDSVASAAPTRTLLHYTGAEVAADGPWLLRHEVVEERLPLFFVLRWSHSQASRRSSATRPRCRCPWWGRPALSPAPFRAR